MTKPHLVLLPGAWHVPAHYSKLIAALGRHDFDVSVDRAASLDSTTTVLTDDVNAARDGLIMPYLNAGRDVVVIAHSYGGSIAGFAASGLSPGDRKDQGAVLGLIYINAHLLPEHISAIELFGSNTPPWLEVNDGVSKVKETDAFYGSCTKEDAAIASAQLRPQGWSTVTSRCSITPAWKQEGYRDRLEYIASTKDLAVPTAAQQYMMSQSKLDWRVTEIEADHSPFICKSEETASLIVEIIQRLSN